MIKDLKNRIVGWSREAVKIKQDPLFKFIWPVIKVSEYLSKQMELPDEIMKKVLYFLGEYVYSDIWNGNNRGFLAAALVYISADVIGHYRSKGVVMHFTGIARKNLTTYIDRLEDMIGEDTRRKYHAC